MSWKPNASIATLTARAHYLAAIRQFFAERRVLEVETPVLSQASGTDVHLQQWQTSNGYYLHTSPEFAMKRLLAAGSGDIFQLARVFRLDEQGSRHNPEFTMLEWYRLGFDEFQLMQEVTELIKQLSGQSDLAVQNLSYSEVFLAAGLPNPHAANVSELRQCCEQHLSCAAKDWSLDDCLDALMSMVVEPSLAPNQLTYIYNYPAQQAALARHHEVDGVLLARRFELYWQGMELANGYFELTDAQEQQRRFLAEEQARREQNLAPVVIDQHFIAALQHGMPSCAGVALGVDRLLMILLGKKRIEEVLAFSQQRS
ncbi:EF-P lysine aminoacylase EpmA [Reinekea thalattae]|uniref:EF-P lysine aminoacylase GenX n=1 Tax=Reinekea thalattae TaxID=2593301 RepID=A0A5C8ZAG7_9GAMM|nr:EF-P lysine aminoacylase EpmA [Reinekea thalattae]TXR54168.1 EF-P lysine aminoacylase GenX [Reinekea thalattae]